MATRDDSRSTIGVQLSDLEALRPFVEAETGMDFSGNRLTRLRDGVNKVLAPQNSPASLERLLGHASERAVFLERLTAELTVGESFFFRNAHHFRALRDEVLPAILRENAERREVRVWSAGCAGGEEPYSLAILFDQLTGGLPGWRVSVLGTDLNPEFLARARRASYRLWSFRQTNIHEDRKYFSREGEMFQLAPRVCEHVRFSYLNLVKDVYPSPLTGTLGLDLILFRNVAIYLKPEITRQILERFYHALRPGGWLLLGETEVSLAITPGFLARRFEQATFHQKSDAAESWMENSPIAAPILSDSGSSPEIKAPSPLVSVPALPDWVPLPRKTETAPVSASRPAGTPDDLERLLREQKFDEAERRIDKLTDRKRRAGWWFRLAQGLLMGGSADRARQMLDRCLGDESLLIEAQLLLASFAEEAGDLDQAERVYRRALYLDRNCPMAHFHLGLVLQQKGDETASRRSFQTTLKLIENRDPRDLVEHGEGVCYGRLQEMVQMILAF